MRRIWRDMVIAIAVGLVLSFLLIPRFGESQGVGSVNIRAWFGSTAPTVGQKTMANSIPVVISSDQAPASATPCTTIKPINQSASAQVITGTVAQKLYICSIDLVADVAMKVSIVEGTGSVCATGIAALWGGTTADATNGMSFAVNGGMAKTSGSPFVKTITAADNLCVIQSAAGLLAGSISFVSAP